MNSVNLLKIAYGANVLILVPTVYNMLAGSGVANVFEDKVNESAGLRIMVGSLWAAILVASIAGLFWPRFFAPLLLIQVFYKTLWLALFVLPLAQVSGWSAVPIGISVTFLLIVLIYPFLFWFGLRGTGVMS
ncbi:MAG: hypothetical protein ACRCU5_12700 [Rhizobiaceae bacterium]